MALDPAALRLTLSPATGLDVDAAITAVGGTAKAAAATTAAPASSMPAPQRLVLQ